MSRAYGSSRRCGAVVGIRKRPLNGDIGSIVHSLMGKLQRLELADRKDAECVAHFCAADFVSQKPRAILSHQFESRLAWNGKDETSFSGLEWSAKVLRTPVRPLGGWEGTGSPVKDIRVNCRGRVVPVRTAYAGSYWNQGSPLTIIV